MPMRQRWIVARFKAFDQKQAGLRLCQRSSLHDEKVVGQTFLETLESRTPLLQDIAEVTLVCPVKLLFNQ